MRIAARYSHLNGVEFLMVHRPSLWTQVQEIINQVDAEACKTKQSKEARKKNKILYSPTDMNNAFKLRFNSCGWKERRSSFWVTDDEKILRRIHSLPEREQKEIIEAEGKTAIFSYNQTDFVKERVAVELQFGKYPFVAHDLFVKHLSFFDSDLIDVAIEIVPMKEMEQQMSSGVAYYERDLLNVIRQGRGAPAVPLVLLGVLP